MAKKPPESKPGQSPSSDLQHEADQLREAAKWLLATLGAIATVLVAGMQFTSIGAVPAGTRTWAAIGGASLAILAVVSLIGIVLNVLMPSDVTIEDLQDSKRARRLGKYLDENPSWLQGYESVQQLAVDYRVAAEAWVLKHRASHDAVVDETKTAKEREDASTAVEQAFEWASWLDEIVGYLTKGMSVEQLRGRLGPAHRGAALAAAALVGLGIGLFAWGTNAPKPVTAPIALRGAQLTNADLRGVNLASADLSGANLKGANLTGASLTGVVWNDTICPDGTNSNSEGDTCLGHLGG